MNEQLAITTTTAHNNELLDQIFQLRHQIFCDEYHYFLTNAEKRLYDKFDSHPATTNLVAISEGQVIAGLRLSLDSKIGVPADSFYNFRAHLPKDSRIMGSGMYCISSEYRCRGITRRLLKKAYLYSKQHRISHIIAPINPPTAAMFKTLGFKVINHDIIKTAQGTRFIPAVLRLNFADKQAKQFVEPAASQKIR